MPAPSHKPPAVLESLLALAIWAIAALPAWFRGGTPAEVQPPFLTGGIVLLLLAGILGNRRAADLSGRRWAWLRDPVFYLGLIFITLLTLQGWNAGRVWFFDPGVERWDYTPPPRPGWPWAFSRDEAMEMLRWFVPAWAIVMTLRGSLLRSPTVFRLWRGLVAGAAVLAAVAIAQACEGGAWLYGMDYVRAGGIRFFGGFGCENHAASFFLLMSALSAGLLMHDALRTETRGKWRRLAVSIPALLLSLAAVFLTFSRGGILLAAVFVVTAIAYGMFNLWPRLTPPARVNLVAGGFAILTLVAMAVIAFGRGSVKVELGSLVGEIGMRTGAAPGAMKDRTALATAAWETWKQHPVFGVGGWGCRYLLYRSLPQPTVAGDFPAGFANIHNDPLQFLAEFGLVGAAAMVLAVLLLIAPCLRPVLGASGRVPFAWTRPAVFFALLGAGLVFVHSLVDLPFRCPAVLWSWCAVLGGASLLCRHEFETVRGKDGD